MQPAIEKAYTIKELYKTFYSDKTTFPAFKRKFLYLNKKGMIKAIKIGNRLVCLENALDFLYEEAPELNPRFKDLAI